jgi:predicted DsbA family dithiol-disulfide isomerase
MSQKVHMRAHPKGATATGGGVSTANGGDGASTPALERPSFRPREHPVVVAPGTIVVFADIACPWSHLAVHRLHETRVALGLRDVVTFEPRAFPLEVVNERPTPRTTVDAEVAVVGALDPSAGWQRWQEDAYPITTLLALEAVQAAGQQGAWAAEALDRALRQALFAHGRNVSMRHEILDVARTCDGVDHDALRARLDAGAARAAIFEQAEVARRAVRSSPHLFLADGTDAPNPGVTTHWEGGHDAGFPVVDAYDPGVYENLLRRAAETAPGRAATGRS